MRASVIAHGDASPVFYVAEHVFNFVAFFIEVSIVPVLHFSVFLRRDAGLDAFVF